jgi:hypothetical protein
MIRHALKFFPRSGPEGRLLIPNELRKNLASNRRNSGKNISPQMGSGPKRGLRPCLTRG